MKKAIAVIILCLLSFPAYCLSDREVFDLLSGASKEVRNFPFRVSVPRDYGNFHGTVLPLSTYTFFEPFYEDVRYKQAKEIFATYRFSQGYRWECFLLRVPNMYASDAIDLWVFDKVKAIWQHPLKIAEIWGDEGDFRETRAWIEDLDKDGSPDIVRTTIEEEIDLRAPRAPACIKRKTAVFVWTEGHYTDATREYMQKLDLDKYKFNEEGSK